MGDYDRQRAQADRIIRQRGQASKLRRNSVTRDCWALEVVLNANDRKALRNPTNRVFLITPVGLEVPPSFEDGDSFVWPDKVSGEDKTFRLDAPVTPLQPGDTIIYYEIQVKGPV